MGLLNYSTTIAPDRTAGEIQKVLAGARATKVMTDYELGRPVALTFQIETEFGPRSFRLPVDPAPVLAILRRQRAAGRLDRDRYATPEQAERTAWRIVLEWVKAQVALIETGMARVDQVMLPYMTTKEGGTVYEAFVRQQLALPPGNQDRVIEAG